MTSCRSGPPNRCGNWSRKSIRATTGSDDAEQWSTGPDTPSAGECEAADDRSTIAVMSRPKPAKYVQPYRYPSPHIPMAAIRRFAREVAEKFRPEKIILFGSYAYGTPHAESDVDLMVIMPCRNAIDQAVRIEWECDVPFAAEVHVRTPFHIKRRAEGGGHGLVSVRGGDQGEGLV